MERQPGVGARFWATGWQVQATGDEGIVLRLYVDSWYPQGDAEAAAQEALKRYRLSTAEGDRVEVVETLQTVCHDGKVCSAGVGAVSPI